MNKNIFLACDVSSQKEILDLLSKVYKEISGINDSMERIGGTVSSSLFAIMRGVQILRVHDVNEIKQSVKVFDKLLNS